MRMSLSAIVEVPSRKSIVDNELAAEIDTFVESPTNGGGGGDGDGADVGDVVLNLQDEASRKRHRSMMTLLFHGALRPSPPARASASRSQSSTEDGPTRNGNTREVICANTSMLTRLFGTSCRRRGFVKGNARKTSPPQRRRCSGDGSCLNNRCARSTTPRYDSSPSVQLRLHRRRQQHARHRSWPTTGWPCYTQRPGADELTAGATIGTLVAWLRAACRERHCRWQRRNCGCHRRH